LRAKRYDEATVQANPRLSHLFTHLAGVLAMAGRTEESRAPVRRALELEPGFRIQPLVTMLGGFPLPELTDELTAGCRKAGPPEAFERPARPAAGLQDRTIGAAPEWSELAHPGRGSAGRTFVLGEIANTLKIVRQCARKQL
jgi:hypothetical protein